MDSVSPASSSKESPPVLEAERCLTDDPGPHSMEPRSEMPVLTLSSPNVLEIAAASPSQGEDQLVKSGELCIACICNRNECVFSVHSPIYPVLI